MNVIGGFYYHFSTLYYHFCEFFRVFSYNVVQAQNFFCAGKLITILNCSISLELLILTHFQQMLHFYTPWKHQKTEGFSDVFRGYRSGTLVETVLNWYWTEEILCLPWFNKIIAKKYISLDYFFCLLFILIENSCSV